MEVENIIVEYRQRLRSANIFISFIEIIKDHNLVKIQIIDNKLVVNNHEETFNINFENNIEIQSNSITNLKIEDYFISFRVQIEGDFINMNNLQIDCNTFEINIIPNCDYTLICAHCKTNFSSSLSFKRILELPSENLDMNEWFCHKHSADETVTDDCSIGSKNYNKFDPKINDLFYGQYFILLNKQNLINYEKEKETLKCSNCSNFLGETTSNSSVKFWNENLHFVQSDKKSKYFFKGNSLLQNFDCILKKYLSDLEFGMPTIFNILLTSKNYENETEFLMIQVIDKNLNIFKKNHTVKNVINLKNFNAIKVLYKIPIESKDEQLLILWKNDMNVIMIEISFAMLKEVTESLESRCLLIPPSYRFCNNFKLSYLSI